MKKIRPLSITVNILMIIVLALAVITPYLLTSRFGTLERSQEFLGWNAGEWHQNLGWAFAILAGVHVILNLRWLCATIKNFPKVNRITKVQLIMCLLLLAAMVACIWSGALWGSMGRNATDTVRMVHTLTAWATIWITGMHMGLHCGRFMALFGTKKPGAAEKPK